MSFGRVNADVIAALRGALKQGDLLSHADDLGHYGHDETEDLVYAPEVVVRPHSTEEVVRIVKICAQYCIPITPIGGRTGLSGGALAVHGGVGLALDRMDRIENLDMQNLQVTVQPGVITQVLMDAVEAHGLYYAPDPSSKGSCTIGGNLAENAGGPRAVKYGVTRDFVLNLEVVLPTGEVIWTGANTLKNATGYDLTRLLVGSEGTLGIITKAVLRLIPRPKTSRLMLVPFNSATKACEAVSAVFRAGITPSALEFMERDAIDFTLKHVPGISIVVPPEVHAHLLVEVDGQYEEGLMTDCATILDVMEAHGCGEVLFAESSADKDALWKLRRNVPVAVKAHTIYKEEDAVVPRFALPRLLQGVKDIGTRYGFRSICYGHAGDGNLHINIIKDGVSDEFWNHGLTMAIRELFQLTVALGGTISGEHGIGLVQRRYMDIAFDSVQLDLMRGLKRLFDPQGIMNPGKVLPNQLPSGSA